MRIAPTKCTVYIHRRPKWTTAIHWQHHVPLSNKCLTEVLPINIYVIYVSISVLFQPLASCLTNSYKLIRATLIHPPQFQHIFNIIYYYSINNIISIELYIIYMFVLPASTPLVRTIGRPRIPTKPASLRSIHTSQGSWSAQVELRLKRMNQPIYKTFHLGDIDGVMNDVGKLFSILILLW